LRILTPSGFVSRPRIAKLALKYFLDVQIPDTPSTVSAGATRSDKLVKLLKGKRGATIDQLREASGWQAHSVRGFLSGTVKKKLGLMLVRETCKDGVHRYRISG
jgi:hypothetical protein